MEMNLYQKQMQMCMDLLAPYEPKILSVQPHSMEDAGEYNMILRQDMAYELGGGTMPAVSGALFTSSNEADLEDEILLYGPDLQEITADTPYARLTFLQMEEDVWNQDSQQLYGIFRKIDYTRYHVNPKGYMMRISSAKEREPVRIGKQELKNGMDFAKVGSLFIESYKQHKEIKKVKTIFITLPDFPYKELAKIVHQSEQITESLNKIFQHLQMDCSVCGLKEICDEVEGMKELHLMHKE